MAISLRNVSKSYRDAERTLTVLSGLSFEFPDSGSVAIVGKSGVGKSTLLHVLGGLDSVDTGGVFYSGTNISSFDTDEVAAFRAENVGFIFQFHHLLPEFTAVENIAMPLFIRGVGWEAALDKAESVLGQVGLSARSGHRPSELSGGEQQRVAIARAIVGEPKIVLADEPTGNLDHVTAGEVQALLIDMNRRLNNVLIIVTHNNELAQSLDVSLEMVPGGQLERRR